MKDLSFIIAYYGHVQPASSKYTNLSDKYKTSINLGLAVVSYFQANHSLYKQTLLEVIMEF